MQGKARAKLSLFAKDDLFFQEENEKLKRIKAVKNDLRDTSDGQLQT